MTQAIRRHFRENRKITRIKARNKTNLRRLLLKWYSLSIHLSCNVAWRFRVTVFIKLLALSYKTVTLLDLTRHQILNENPKSLKRKADKLRLVLGVLLSKLLKLSFIALWLILLNPLTMSIDWVRLAKLFTKFLFLTRKW